MRVVVSTYPQKKLYEGDVESSAVVDDVIKQVSEASKFDATGRALIVEKNQNFHRIPLDDPVNTYYNGHIGELYCVMDSSVRYRLVTPPNPPSKGTNTSPNRPATAEMYAAGYENILTMLEERNTSDLNLRSMSIPKKVLIQLHDNQEIHHLTIPDLSPDARTKPSGDQIQNSRGQYVYVFFLNPEQAPNPLLSRATQAVKALLETNMKEVIDHHNSKNPDQQFEFEGEMSITNQDFALKFRAMFEMIIVHNNPSGKTEVDVGYSLYQPLSIQKISFIVTKHIDQPIFKLLHPDTDRGEIRNMYAHNGRTLDRQETIGSYGFRDGVRLILI